MAWAERDGLFEVKALVSGNSTEGNEIISTSSSALVVVGKPPRASNIESLQSINGCHAVIAPCINPWQK
jgi:hypothetical protein